MNQTPLTTNQPAPPGALPRLSVMMFLQYAVWGLWLPILAVYLTADKSKGGLGFTDGQMGSIIGWGASIGAVTAPFIAGQFADRYFRAERFLAALLFFGGIVQIFLAQQTTFTGWLVLSILYSILYMPTLSLTNSVAFANLSNTETQFPKVRVFGTFGWIAAAWLFPLFWLLADVDFQWLPPFYKGVDHPDVTARLIDAMTFSGILSILYSVYCLALPATPPKKDGVESIAFAKAFALCTRPSVLVLVVSSLIIAMIHQLYFFQTGKFLVASGLSQSYVLPAMSIGQFAEIIVMAFLGLMLTRIGFRWVIAMGAFAYVLRYGIWATPDVPLWMLVSSQALHGFCYACFFAGTYIYIDRVAPKDVRNSAQTVIGIVILGLGPVLATVLQGLIFEYTGKPLTEDAPVEAYREFWAVLAALGFFVTLIVALLFRQEQKVEEADVMVPEPELP